MIYSYKVDVVPVTSTSVFMVQVKVFNNYRRIMHKDSYYASKKNISLMTERCLFNALSIHKKKTKNLTIEEKDELNKLLSSTATLIIKELESA
jgi:hypothetical protein